MSKTQAGMGSLIWIILVLLGGGILGNFLVTLAAFENTWMQGLVIAFVQALLLSVFGILMGKAGIVQIIYATAAIFIGGVVGGLLIQYLEASIDLGGILQTFIILAIQATILIAAGFVGKGRLRPR